MLRFRQAGPLANRLAGIIASFRHLRVCRSALDTTIMTSVPDASAKQDFRSKTLWRSIMEQVSLHGLYEDSKAFVDCPVLRSWDAVATNWDKLTAEGLTRERLEGFIAENFGLPGSDLKAVLPPGWHEAPPSWLEAIVEPEMRDLGTAVHGLWKTLCRQVCPTVADHAERHTLLPLPHPFIVPGDRFRECYNWDSYWIIRGLLACELVPAAECLVRNLLHLVDVWGFVPNGARRYYTNRSQPPLLSAMVLAVWSASTTGNGNGEDGEGNGDELLKDALPRLLAFHRYWNTGSKAVRVRAQAHGASSELEEGAASGGAEQRQTGEARGEVVAATAVFTLSRYHAELYEPRPESFREDVALAAAAGLSGQEAATLYCDVASAAESGWDFSSRWYVGGDALQYTRTTQIVPADLNAWLYRMERDIAAIAAHLGDARLRDEYTALAVARLRAIDALMWSAADGCWHDLLLLPTKTSPSQAPLPDPAAAPQQQLPIVQHPSGHAVEHNGNDSAGNDEQDGNVNGNRDVSGDGNGDGGRSGSPVTSVRQYEYEVEQRPGVYASNWVPLWCGCADASSARAEAAVAGLRASGLVQPGGLLTSLYRSGQQWDAPNAWPPLVHMAIEGLAESGVPGGAALADQVADSWLAANLEGWRATGAMHEKYDGYVPGAVGRGGEYEPQVGFGWSNGVLMALLQRKRESGGRQ
ncbi:hypothetical protein PLESTF_000033300 [Pleodorina starrii]|nr:hypothetical protein PLESTF_000033300 [Pleodorina starrii]